MQSEKKIGKNYYFLDVMKFICALLILCGHFISENYSLSTPLDCIFSLDIIATPFFFACSGFLLFDKCIQMEKKESKRKLVSWTKRLFTLYFAWSIVYLVFDIIKWIQEGNIATNVKVYLHSLIVYSSGNTIWFLYALIIGGWIVWEMYYHFGVKKTLFFSMLLYLIGSFMYTYSYLIPNGVIKVIYQEYIKIFLTSRNGIFYAPAFIAIGAYLAHKRVEISKKAFVKNTIYSGGMFIFVIIEAFLVKRAEAKAGIEFTILLVPCTYFVLKALISIQVTYHKIYIVLRKLSTEIFVSQRIIITAIPSIWPSFWSYFPGVWYKDLCIVIIVVVVLSEIIIQLSTRNKLIKWLV